jgi:RimJ/RimL family protein N-acetyltransferase
VFLAQQGAADGRGGGRTAYAIRLSQDGDLGPAGTLVGTTALSEADLHNESTHIGSTLYGSRWWGTQVNPEAKLLLMAHCFEAAHETRGRHVPRFGHLQRADRRMARRQGPADGPPRALTSTPAGDVVRS